MFFHLLRLLHCNSLTDILGRKNTTGLYKRDLGVAKGIEVGLKTKFFQIKSRSQALFKDVCTKTSI